MTSGTAGGIVVGVGGFLGRAQCFGDVAEVDADAGPGGGAAAHAVDEDIVDGEECSGFRVFCFPSFEAGEGIRFAG